MSAIERAMRAVADKAGIWLPAGELRDVASIRAGLACGEAARAVIASLRADLASGDPTRTWQATQALGLGMETQAEADCAECDMGDTEHECPPIKYVRVHSYWMEAPDA